METRLINASPAAQNMDKLTNLQCPVPSLPGQEAFLGKHGQMVSHVTQKQGLFPPLLAGSVPEARKME